MGALHHEALTSGALPLSLALLPRDALEALTDALIGHLDALDDDPDREHDGDELDGSLGEDDFCRHNLPTVLAGAGCPIADPDGAVDDDNCDGDEDLEEEYPHVPEYSIDQTAGPLEPLHTSDREATRHWRDRIRATRCRPLKSTFYDPATGGMRTEVRRYQLL